MWNRGNLYLNEALFNHHNEEYHGSKLKPPVEADDDKHEQGAMIPYRITEKAVEVKPGGELAENKSFAPLHGKCDECETD